MTTRRREKAFALIEIAKIANYRFESLVADANPIAAARFGRLDELDVVSAYADHPALDLDGFNQLTDRQRHAHALRRVLVEHLGPPRPRPVRLPRHRRPARPRRPCLAELPDAEIAPP